MTNETENQQHQNTDPPRDPVKSPAAPANPDIDQDAVQKGQENIEKISGN